MAVGAFSTFVIFTGLASLFPPAEKPLQQVIQVTEGPKPNIVQFQPEKACEQPGFYVNPTDCNAFYRCAEHRNVHDMETPVTLIKFRFICPRGLVFDESTQTCNYPYEVENLAEICHYRADELWP